ncbi:MAG: hypothetical protein HY724_09290 [Candidatus Rokubacteria bacterium]|nr:hypothetical protein [Candidatus Rokubacteria bacterium]
MTTLFDVFLAEALSPVGELEDALALEPGDPEILVDHACGVTLPLCHRGSGRPVATPANGANEASAGTAA